MDGISVLRIGYDREFIGRSDARAKIREMLIRLYKGSASNLTRSCCAVTICAEVESADLNLMRAIIHFWDFVTDHDGRVAVIGYPPITLLGDLVPLPPLLPNFALARDLKSALRWIKTPLEIADRHGSIQSIPGVSFGRYLVPGEKGLLTWDRDDVSDQP